MLLVSKTPKPVALRAFLLEVINIDINKLKTTIIKYKQMERYMRDLRIALEDAKLSEKEQKAIAKDLKELVG